MHVTWYTIPKVNTVPDESNCPIHLFMFYGMHKIKNMCVIKMNERYITGGEW